jgi:hypothetical protein
LANLPAWVPPAFLINSSPHGWANPVNGGGGGQHYMLHNSYVDMLQHIIPTIPNNGSIDSWLTLAQNREQWKTLGTEWLKGQQALTIYHHGTLSCMLAPSTISMNGTYGRYTKDTMDNNSIPICSSLPLPTCHCLFMYSPLCAANVPWSFGSLLFCSFSLRWLPEPCILPWCAFLDAFCTLSIYPFMFLSICQHLFQVTDLTTRGCSFFGDSNCLTLFICYPGSIEKLTLLGAIYYYYYYY